MYKIPLSQINTLFDKIAESEKLYMPVKKEDKPVFDLYKKGTEYDSELNTTRSAKDFFFPQVQDIASFVIKGKAIDIIQNNKSVESFVLFGVRACDAKSFLLLDRVFLCEPEDPYYKESREKSTVITTACEFPGETCFCTAFGIDPSEPAGDVSTWITNNNLYWQWNTEKGEILTERTESVLTVCDDDEIEKYKFAIKEKTDKLPFGKLNLSYWKESDEKEIFSSPIWDDIYKGCLGCGTCTFICPTCQCYDIRDFDSGKAVNRFRCWDSCMYSDFTKMAHGNPRKTQKERFRQRFMHKLKYFPENNDGEFSCVGCGRCIRSCPQSLHIIKVARSVK